MTLVSIALALQGRVLQQIDQLKKRLRALEKRYRAHIRSITCGKR